MENDINEWLMKVILIQKGFKIMTKEEFKQYSELQEKFAKDVDRVTN